MGFKEIVSKLGSKSKERKEVLKNMEQQARFQKITEDRMKSSNERELERFMQEEREDEIKEALKVMRKRRENDIKFNHNPLDTPNITSGTQWEVLKEKNLFNKKGNMFSNQHNTLKNNNNLLKNNMRLLR